jgi:ABC-type dipeptide/oligopeptide/nickel transport system permease subunit
MWYILSPLIAISLLQLSAIWLVRSLEEMLNPRLRAQG